MKSELKALDKKLGFKKETDKAPKEATAPTTTKPGGKGPLGSSEVGKRSSKAKDHMKMLATIP